MVEGREVGLSGTGCTWVEGSVGLTTRVFVWTRGGGKWLAGWTGFLSVFGTVERPFREKGG